MFLYSDKRSLLPSLSANRCTECATCWSTSTSPLIQGLEHVEDLTDDQGCEKHTHEEHLWRHSQNGPRFLCKFWVNPSCSRKDTCSEHGKPVERCDNDPEMKLDPLITARIPQEPQREQPQEDSQ